MTAVAFARTSSWSEAIPAEQWQVYEFILDEAHARRIPFALGGAFALAAYTGRCRNTKDLDLYVLPENRDRMIETLTDLGMRDYYDTKPYDRWWIYRGANDNTIVDIIWAMANHRQQIDDLWMSGPEIDVQGRRLKVLPAEAMMWDKMYIMQRDRCDWPDVLNLLYSVGPEIDWEYLLYRIGDDTPVLAGVLSVYRWISPGRASLLPGWIWERVGLERPAGELPEIEPRRVSLLDTRPWYGPQLRNPRAA
jgi:hypothetical protein